MKIDKGNYSRGLKVSIALLQGVCVGVLAVCIMIVNFWLGGTFSFSSLGLGFEQTQTFLHDSEDMVRRKIACTQNLAIFQTDGETDLNKRIDIRQYVDGITDTANENANTTYLLSDLINLHPQIASLEKEVTKAQTAQDPSLQTWDSLSAAVSAYETSLPVSGMSLAETARQSQTPYETLVDYYTALCETSRDLYARYQSYSAELKSPDGSSSPDAPSNIRYYIEDSSSKQVYTNLSAGSCAQARAVIAEDESLSFLFDGVRTQDIMVADSENTLNQTVASKFIDTVFTGANERVILAVDRSYPAGDILHSDFMAYQRRKPVVAGSLAVSAVCLLLLVLLLGFSIMTTGMESRGREMELKGFDLVPTEIGAGICIVSWLMWYYLSRAVLHRYIPMEYRQAWRVAAFAVGYEIFLVSFLSLSRRFRHKSLWTNSVLCTMVRVGSQVMEARVTSRRLLVVYVLFVGLNFLLLRYAEAVGIVIVLVMDLALLLYLIRDQVGKLSVREGLREISKGKLDYRIDTYSLAGDSLEMAQAVNEMGDGLKEAVDSIVKSERLKAELVTNVSHDLKTPLTSIISYVDLLKRENLDNEKARGYVDVLDRKTQRLKALISDLIDASKISSGNIDLEMTVIDLRQMIVMAEGEFEERFEQIPLHVMMELDQDVKILADGSQLWRVLDNLLGNICKYAKPSSDVSVSLHVNADRTRARAVFENESAQRLEKTGQELEERFVRGDLSRNSEGSGLGLSIAKNLTELMGGVFDVETTHDIFRAVLSFPLPKHE